MSLFVVEAVESNSLETWTFQDESEAMAKCKELYFDTFTGLILVNGAKWTPDDKMVEEYHNTI